MTSESRRQESEDRIQNKEDSSQDSGFRRQSSVSSIQSSETRNPNCSVGRPRPINEPQHPAPSTQSPSRHSSPVTRHSPLSHQAISASAGSGKTFRLAHRYIRLLADNVSPDRICALTFSRKAAAEIFDSIVEYLCKASASSIAAKETAINVERIDLTKKDFGLLLRSFMDNLHRMHIGTLDSFMIGVAKTFPAELGIPPEFQVMDSGGATANEVRNTILSQIFDPHITSNEDRHQFIEAFRQATFGQEEKSPGSKLDSFIDERLTNYQQVPDKSLWGTLDAIGLKKLNWLKNPSDPEDVAEELMEAIVSDGLSAAVQRDFKKFADAAAIYYIGSAWPKEFNLTLPGRLLEAIPDLEKGNASIKCGRSQVDLSPSACSATLKLIHHIFYCEMVVALARTTGLYQILDQYEKRYNKYIRQTGQMTFNDAQILLTKSNRSSNGALISRDNSDPEKLYIDYRLDCKLDHWLLDEFQDTSDLQWNALENLAEEIIQDQSGERSFFYVGDVKQAVYAWRGGNAKLFNRILENHSESIELLPINISFRSCPPVIDTVNKIFDDLSPDDGLKSDAVKSWQKVWHTHESAPHLKDKPGYTTLIEPAEPIGKSFTSEDRYNVVSAILNEMQPIKHHLDAAVLVSTNKEGAEVVDHLRRNCPGMSVVHEGSATITDNPVVSLLLSLLQTASHPGDSMAWQHVQMSPLGKVFSVQHSEAPPSPTLHTSPFTLHTSILSSIHTHGFQQTIRHWGTILEEQHPLDLFGRNRLNTLIEAAATFDETSNRNIDEFIRFIEKYSIKEQSAANAIRVMTIHQSKGLGFDVVICPELQPKTKSMVKESHLKMSTALDSEDNPRWVLDMPKRIVSTNVPELDKQVEVIDNNTCYDSLCRLYVALTRAKCALYLVTSKAGEKSVSKTPAAFVKSRLTGDPNPPIGSPITISNYDCALLYENGDRNWFESIPEKKLSTEKVATPTIPSDYSTRSSRRTRLERIEPSTQKEVITKAAHVFATENREVLDFGNAIHAMFEAVEWIENIDPEAIISQWLKESTFNEDVNRDSCKQFREAIPKSDVQKSLARPKGVAELWREKSFEVVLENRWVTGQFDRVTIVRDEKGRALSATILDYKSNRISQPAEFKEAADHYRPQLELYSKALAHILKIPETAINKHLLFTRAGKLIAV